MKVSIVLCSYNGEKYIEEQLDSLRVQTRPADEVMIFDDRSTDRTVKIVQDFIRKYELSGWSMEKKFHGGNAESLRRFDFSM